MSCSRSTSLDFHGCARADGSGRMPFALPGTATRYVRDRDVDLRHVVLDLALDFEARSISGRATHVLKPLRPDVRHVRLDAVDLDVTEVRLNGTAVPFRNDGRQLAVDCGRHLREGRDARLVIRYACTPRRGFYFVVPDE